MKPLHKIFSEDMGLDEKHYDQFIKVAKRITYKKKDILVHEGLICPFIGFIENGLLRSFIRKDEVEHNNAFYFSNEFFSAYNSFTSKKPAISTIQSMTQTATLMITRDQMQALYDQSPTWYKFGKFVADRFFIRKCEHESSLLCDTATERYKALLRLYPAIEQLVPQYQIASYLKIKPESLSRIKTLTYINK